MRQLVGGHIIKIVVLIRIAKISVPAKILRIGNGIGKGLGEFSITRELQNPHLPKLVRAKIFLKITQAIFKRSHHPIQVIGMFVVVENFNVDRFALRTYPFVAQYRIPRRHQIEEIINFAVLYIMKIPPPLVLPFLLQIAGRDGNLIGHGADGTFKGNEVGIVIEQQSFFSVGIAMGW